MRRGRNVIKVKFVFLKEGGGGCEEPCLKVYKSGDYLAVKQIGRLAPVVKQAVVLTVQYLLLVLATETRVSRHVCTLYIYMFVIIYIHVCTLYIYMFVRYPLVILRNRFQEQRKIWLTLPDRF